MAIKGTYDLKPSDHGRKITCIIKGISIEDAEICYWKSENYYYILQNKCSGSSPGDLSLKKDYKYSWSVARGDRNQLYMQDVSLLTFLDSGDEKEEDDTPLKKPSSKAKPIVLLSSSKKFIKINQDE